jgi:O-antigen/teichoic acid export membrane protein
MAALGCLFTSVLLAIPLLIFKDFIIRFVFSEKYLPAAVVLLPLTICQVFVVMHQAYGTAWQGLGKPGVPSTTITIAAVINIVTGYFLTKEYGIAGAATSLAISAVAAWLMMTLVWNRWVKRGGLEMASIGKEEI